jgi:hypothetical protein
MKSQDTAQDRLGRYAIEQTPYLRLDGSVAPLGPPDPVRLVRHVARYGRDGAEPWLESGAETVSSTVSRPAQRALKTPHG